MTDGPLPPLWEGGIRRLIQAVRAKDKGEALAICYTRRAFVRCLTTDTRTRDLFAQWRHTSKLDLVVTEWRAQLDAATACLRLAERALLLDYPRLWDRLPVGTRAIFADCALVYDLRVRNSQAARAADIDHFISRVLYSEPPPIRAWLGVALLDAFEEDLARELRGDDAVQSELTVDALVTLPNGMQPRGDGAHLERDAKWYYALHVQEPRARVADLAAAYIAARRQVAPLAGTKDSGDDVGRTPRINDSLVRYGAANAQRLLECCVSPDEWHRFDRFFRRRHRQKGARRGRGRP